MSNVKGKGQRLIPEELLKYLEALKNKYPDAVDLVEANPTLEGGEESLSSVLINGTKYAVGGGNKIYRHHITITTYGQSASIDFDVISTKSDPYTTTTLRNLGTIICDNVPILETITNGYRLTYFTKITISSNDNFAFNVYYLNFNSDNTITEYTNTSQLYLLKTVIDTVTEA